MLHRAISGSGPNLMLLHPVGLSSAFWPVLAGRMSQTRRVTSVDLAGHGASPDAKRPGQIFDHVAELAEMIEADGNATAVLGVSFGGMIAMHLALERPELVSALILGACPPAIPETGRAGILSRGASAEAGGMEAVVDDTLNRWFTPEFLSTEAVEGVRARLLDNKPSNWAAAWEAVASHDALPRLGEIRAPTLVIAGEADAATPIAAKRRLAEAIPGARLEVIKGAPHMVHIERARDFTDLVDGFLGKHT